MKRERTARITGVSGRDLPLGTNVHRGVRTDVALDTGMRTRHAYIVGQTGTGKSTLLLRGILHDIQAGPEMHPRGPAPGPVAGESV